MPPSAASNFSCGNSGWSLRVPYIGSGKRDTAPEDDLSRDIFNALNGLPEALAPMFIKGP